MSFLRKFLVAVILPLALLAGNVAAAADRPDEQFAVAAPLTNDRYTGINLADGFFSTISFSNLQARTGSGTSPDSRLLTRTLCKKIGDVGCEGDKYFKYGALLGNCGADLTTDCITKVSAINAEGKEVSGRFVEAFPGETALVYRGDASIDLPTGSSAFIVEFPGIEHAGGREFLVVAFMSGSRGFGAAKFTLNNFNSGIFAISRVAGVCSTPKPDPEIRSDHILAGDQINGGGCDPEIPGATKPICAMSSATHCAVPWTLPVDVTFGISFKLKTKVKGWLHGRLKEAIATINTASDGDQLLTIQGKPSVVPGIHAWYPKNSLPIVLRNYYSDKSQVSIDSTGGGWPSRDGKSVNGPDGLPYSILKLGSDYNEGSFPETLAWITAVGDKATYAPTSWAFRSIEAQGYESCMRGAESLSGLVSTNSTMYVGSPPTFDKASQSLDYKVMSPHYLPNGEEFKGSYDLVIRSDVARCIYGFTNAPVSATISILASDGTTQVATTTFNERNGWMYLIARGFTFSAPTLRVKLSQAVTPSKNVTKPKVKKLSITCMKGRSSRTVSAVKPLCPSGWKKK